MRGDYPARETGGKIAKLSTCVLIPSLHGICAIADLYELTEMGMRSWRTLLYHSVSPKTSPTLGAMAPIQTMRNGLKVR